VPPIVVVPPADIPAGAVGSTPVGEATTLPLVQNEITSEYPVGVPEMILGVQGGGVRMPEVLVALAPPPAPPPVVVVETPPAVGVTPPFVPPVYVAPVRMRKPDRN
jgi:hypothetical protein